MHDWHGHWARSSVRLVVRDRSALAPGAGRLLQFLLRTAPP
jgi:hypothetical protein